MENCVIQLQGVSYNYHDEGKNSLSDIDLKIKQGEFILIAGESGSGKTTLSKCINGLIPYFHEGFLMGDILVNGKNTRELELHEIGEAVGSVFQDPRSQFFTTNTTDEVAFGCQNMGLSRTEILQRIDWAFTSLHVDALRDRSIFQLSSGEKQKIAIASCCAMTPGIYVFDEPSANLDIPSTLQLAQIMKLLKELGNTILVIEHRLYYLTELIDRVLFMAEGKISKTLMQSDIVKLTAEELSAMGLRQFDLARAARTLVLTPKKPETTFSVKGLSFTYKKYRQTQPEKVLRSVEFAAQGGEIIGLIGRNGAGKTTLTKLCSGLLKENAGVVYLNGKQLSAKERIGQIYFVMQDSDYQLFSDSVTKELQLGITPHGNLENQCENTLEALDLLQFKDYHPAALSRGQKQRLTIANAMMCGANILFFDEPTSGLDGKNMHQVADRLNDLAEKGKIVFVVTHDYEFLLTSCTRILYLQEGVIAEDFALETASTEKLKHLLFQSEGGTVK